MTGQQLHEQAYTAQQPQQQAQHPHSVQPPLHHSMPPAQQHHMANPQAYHQQLGNVAGTVMAPTTATTGQPVFDLGKFWLEQMQAADAFNSDFKNHPLPLARIKKVMKTDQDVKMISAEAPILFAKGCEIFITELTKRAWVHAEENKRRTLQRSDIATAVSKTDMCDFLIDIVPREEAAKSTTATSSHTMYDQNAAAYAAQQNSNNAAAAAAAAAAYYQQPQYANPSAEPQAYYQSLSQLNDPVQQQYQMLIAQQQQHQQQQQQQQLKYDQSQPPKFEHSQQQQYDQQSAKYENDGKSKQDPLN